MLKRRQPDDNVYVLLDPLAACKPEHPLSITSLTGVLGKKAIVRVTRADLPYSPRHWPVLVQFPASSEMIADFLALTAAYAAREKTAIKQYVCGWLTSEQPAEIIAQHIGQQGHALSPSGEEAFTPWFEPLRLALLQAVMNNAGVLLGPVGSWIYPDICGGFAAIEGRPSRGGLEIPTIARDVQNLEPQISQLLQTWRDLNSPANVQFTWQRPGPTGLPRKAAAQALSFVQEARQQGLRSRADIHCLSLHRVIVHPHLLQHPTIQSDVAHAVAGKQSLSSRFAAYNHSAWSQIVAALPQPKGCQ